MSKLLEIQSKLEAPKNLKNKFGNYNYRSCEGILEALKPLLKENGCELIITDEIVPIGSRIYVKSTAILTSDEKAIATVTAYAREEEVKKGMDSSQITGAASSYARKYALNGMFLIDDNKDSDSTNQHGKEDVLSPKPLKQDDASGEIKSVDIVSVTRDASTEEFEIKTKHDSYFTYNELIAVAARSKISKGPVKIKITVNSDMIPIILGVM